MNKMTNGFIEALGNDNNSLKLFIDQLGEFDRKFCEAMLSQADFTLRLEVKGNRGSLSHIRIFTDDIKRVI